MATNIAETTKLAPEEIFAGPQAESVVVQEIKIANNQGGGLIQRGTALRLDGTKYKTLNGGATSVDAICAEDTDTSSGDTITTAYTKGGFGDRFIDFGDADLDAVEDEARENGIFFHKVFK